MLLKLLLRPVLGACLAALCSLGTAQTYPVKPLRVFVGQAAGGAVDTVARSLAERLTLALGQPVVVESRPGAGGMLAAEAVARSAPDGYALGLLDVGALAVNPVLQKRVAYDVGRDFAYLGLVAKIPLVLVASPTLPVAGLPALTGYLRQNPGRLSYASAGVGSPPHMAMEAYKQHAAVFVTHIPYRGAAPGLADLVAGHIPLMFVDTNLGSQYAKAGKVKAIAVATRERNAQMPEVPTFDEGGVKGFEFAPWVGLVAPAGVPPEVAARLEQALRGVMASPEMAGKIRSLGFVPLAGEAAPFAAFARKELAEYRHLIDERKIRIDE